MVATDRDRLREQVTNRRLTHPPTERARADRARTRRVIGLVDELLPAPGLVSCYLSREPEPDTIAIIGHIWPRHQVIVPALLGADGPDWAFFEGLDRLIPGLSGIPEPTGVRLGAQVITRAGLHIISALTCGIDGSRLGTGGGWYDRALAVRDPRTPIIALLNEDEVAQVSQEAHDIPVDYLVTPERTITTRTRLARG